MENKYFNIQDSLAKICEEYPETIPVFTSVGFAGLDNAETRQKLGTIQLEMALSLKQINLNTFCENLIEVIEQNRSQVDSALNSFTYAPRKDALKISGLLPCPVRIPLEEGLNKFKDEHNKNADHPYETKLKSASEGLDWLKEDLEGVTDASEIDDIYISAGFDMFFDKKLFGKFADQNVFSDISGLKKYNHIFDNDTISLRDPRGQYSMLAVVPAVFLINTRELGDREVPQSWEDILKPEFENSISLPISDFDLFNAILLHLNQKYGKEAIEKLGRSLLQNMHPAQMVKSHQKAQNKPAVTIMPYFFTKMAKEGGVMQAVWPKDGAIISPIFMISKAKHEEALKPAVDFFNSYDVAEILALNGLFPSINPDIDNKIPVENKFMWLGWDYIYEHDISEMITNLMDTFYKSTNV